MELQVLTQSQQKVKMTQTKNERRVHFLCTCKQRTSSAPQPLGLLAAHVVWTTIAHICQTLCVGRGVQEACYFIPNSASTSFASTVCVCIVYRIPFSFPMANYTWLDQLHSLVKMEKDKCHQDVVIYQRCQYFAVHVLSIMVWMCTCYRKWQNIWFALSYVACFWGFLTNGKIINEKYVSSMCEYCCCFGMHRCAAPPPIFPIFDLSDWR